MNDLYVRLGMSMERNRPLPAQGRQYWIGDLFFPWFADARCGPLSAWENKRGYRSLGGDKGDLHFQGYTVDSGTILDRVMLHTSLTLSGEEPLSVAQQIVEEAFTSIGPECVEHS